MACPDEGSFTGWKKCYINNEDNSVTDVLVKLSIPVDAKRSSDTGRKCRCDKAYVMHIERLDNGEHVDEAFSYHDSGFIYKVGYTVYVNNFDEDRFKECAPGIHFFINKQEAIDYEI